MSTVTRIETDEQKSEQDRSPRWPSVEIAVVLPCYNEAATIADVIATFHRDLPEAQVYVYDNNSTDDTAARARAAGARVRREGEQGKGNVVRRMFADVDADIYLLSDGDLTYDVSGAAALITVLLGEQLDMIVGARRHVADDAYRPGHRLGNRLFNRAANVLFGSRLNDMFSGYRLFSRRFVKSFPAVSKGFEIETELTVHAIDLRVPVIEVPVDYHARPRGSESKLRTIPDGLRILWTLVLLAKEVRPLAFFSVGAAVLAALAIGLGAPLVATYLETGLVPRLPTAILVTGLMVLATLSLACGFILDSVSKARHEAKRLAYLGVPLKTPE